MKYYKSKIPPAASASQLRLRITFKSIKCGKMGYFHADSRNQDLLT